MDGLDKRGLLLDKPREFEKPVSSAPMFAYGKVPGRMPGRIEAQRAGIRL